MARKKTGTKRHKTAQNGTKRHKTAQNHTKRHKFLCGPNCFGLGFLAPFSAGEKIYNRTKIGGNCPPFAPEKIKVLKYSLLLLSP